MISIIISSYNKDYYSQFIENVEKTIGVPYEIIQILNIGAMGVCEAYNKGARQAKFEYLVFCHEDITFETKNWGGKLVNHFKTNDQIGLVGVAGSFNIPPLPYPWFLEDEYVFLNINQYEKDELIFKKRYKEQNNRQIKVLDGVFLACEKYKFDEIKFSNNLLGYHCYDIDISIRFAEKYLNTLLSEVIINHFSLGNFNKDWYKEALKCWTNNKEIIKKQSNFTLLSLRYYNYFLKKLEFSFMKRCVLLWKAVLKSYFCKR